MLTAQEFMEDVLQRAAAGRAEREVSTAVCCLEVLIAPSICARKQWQRKKLNFGWSDLSDCAGRFAGYFLLTPNFFVQRITLRNIFDNEYTKAASEEEKIVVVVASKIESHILLGAS